MIVRLSFLLTCYKSLKEVGFLLLNLRRQCIFRHKTVNCPTTRQDSTAFTNRTFVRMPCQSAYLMVMALSHLGHPASGRLEARREHQWTNQGTGRVMAHMQRGEWLTRQRRSAVSAISLKDVNLMKQRHFSLRYCSGDCVFATASTSYDSNCFL